MDRSKSNKGTSGQSRGFNRRGGDSADWAKADADVLRRAIVAAALRHGALRFGYTSDGGAYSIGIYGDGDPYTEYVRPSDDIDSFLTELAQYFEEMA